MSTEFDTLVKIQEVTDCDTAMHQTGDIEMHYTDKQLEDFFKAYGERGRDNLVKSLAMFMHNLESAYRKHRVSEIAVEENVGVE